MRLGLPVLLLLGACAANDVTTDIAALRTNPGSASQRELKNVLSTALGGVDVTIAENALTQNSTLIVERAKQRGIDRPNASGRDFGRPDHFRLVIDVRQCLLIHQETGLRWMLNETECSPE